MNRNLLKLFCLASGLAVLITGWRAHSFHRRAVDAAREQAVALTTAAAARVDAALTETMTAVRDTAGDLTSGKLAYGGIDARLKKTLDANPRLRSVNAAFAPGAYKPGLKLHAPYWVRDPDGVRATENAGDYTEPEIYWYARAAASGKPVWTAPFYRITSKTLTAVYSAPFYRGGKLAGVVSASISLDEIKRLVESLDLGPSGFGELLAADGTYLYHPRNEYVLARRTILDLAKEFGDADRLAIAPRAQRGESGLVDHRSTTTGQRSWLIYAPVPSAGWSLHNTFLRADIPYDSVALRRRAAQLMLAAVCLVLGLTGLTLRVDEKGRLGLWTLSVCASVAFAAGIAVLWTLTLRLDSHAEPDGLQIYDRAVLQRMVDGYKELCATNHAEPPIFVPTGVYVQTARFSGPNEVVMTGFVWQRYDASTKGLSQGFSIQSAADVKIAETLREREGDAEIVRWSFQAVVHENMDFAHYPLDQETIELGLRHKDLDHNVVLTPDLSSYKILAATARPGLSPELRIPGWEVEKTYFDTGGKIDNTTFGLSRSVAKADFPGLEYNILMRRNLLDAFISNLAPIVIALILLFALQMSMMEDEKKAAFMQLTSGRLVNICVSMFFVIVFAHISVRRGLAAEEIFYLEYFYFTTYMMILWTAINSIVYFKRRDWAWLQHEENLHLKLLFWPVVTGILFAASVATFY